MIVLCRLFYIYGVSGSTSTLTKEANPFISMLQKGDRDCKYCLDIDAYEIREAYVYNMSARDTREVRKIILQYFDDIVEAWKTAFGAPQ